MRMPCRNILQQNHLIKIRAYKCEFTLEIRMSKWKCSWSKLVFIVCIQFIHKKHFVLPLTEKNKMNGNKRIL